MKLPVRFQAAAELEAVEAFNWYESQQAGLGEHFAEALDKCLDTVTAFPNSKPLLTRNIRCARIHKYPFQLIFSVEADYIKIWSVFHTSRDPQILAERIKPQ